MAEAAKMYKKDGFYYVFISQWIKKDKVNDRKQLVLRSKSPYGPYESKVVLERGNGCNRSCCQGSLIKAPDGNWWFMHQLVQSKDSYEGRPQFLIPVSWENDWPVLGEDPDGNGIGNTIWQWKKPVSGGNIIKPQTSDDFDYCKLSPQWAWYYTPNNLKWSLTERDGYLRMRPVRQLSPEDFLKTPNILSQRKMGKGKDTATVRICLTELSVGINLGMTNFSSDYNNIGLKFDGKVCKIYENRNGNMTFLSEYVNDVIYFRTIMNGDKGILQYSQDGLTFIGSSDEFIMRPKGFMSQRIGFYCYNNDSDTGFVDIDWFKYTYE